MEPASAMYKYIKVVVPKNGRPYLKRKLFDSDVFLTDVRDRFFPTEESSPFPSARLRYQVHGTVDRESFANVGQSVANDILTLIESAGRDASQIRSVLDFGCGCGRVLRYLEPRLPNASFFGADIDPDAVTWCRAHLPFAEYALNRANPPMDFEDKSFDLIYGISVFTHLDEELQLSWLEELRRVAKPGGLVIVSVSGLSYYESRLRKDLLDQLKKNGILFRIQNIKKDTLPDFYQRTFHTREYIEKTWGKFFNILEYTDMGIGNHQDAISMTPR